MSESDANSSSNNNQRNKNNTGRGGRGRGRSGSSSHTNQNNRKKGQIKQLGNNVFEVAKSERFERTTRRLEKYVGKKYGAAARHVIKNHKNPTINYPADIDKTTATRTEQLIYEANI